MRRKANRISVRFLLSWVLSLISGVLVALLYAVRSMQTQLLQQQPMKMKAGSTVTCVGFMTMPLDYSGEGRKP